MKRLEDHLAAILAGVRPLTPVALPLLEAYGCVLAEQVTATVDLPGFDNSAMDGYAVRAADVGGASAEHPVVLTVTADIPAGRVPDRVVGAGETARIMTGAPLPAGADAVVPVEWTDGGTETVAVQAPAEPGRFVRRRGEDVTAGQAVLGPGTPIGPRQVAVLAAVGRDRVRARPRPRVLVLSTGSELVPPGGAPRPGRIYDSNSFTLAAAVSEAGGVPVHVGAVPDDAKALTAVLEEHLPQVDAVVTSGGVSVGAYDVVKEALAPGGAVEFARVAMQPGMPQGFGTLGPTAVPIFTLPGNPVSVYVSFELFVRPALRRMRGLTDLHRPVIQARCTAAFASPEGRRQFQRARLSRPDGGEAAVTPVGGPGSHLLGGLSQADCLIIVPEERTHVPEGTTVEVMLLDGPTAAGDRP